MTQMNKPFSDFARLGVVHFMAFPETMKGHDPLPSLERIAADSHIDVIEITSMPQNVRRQANTLLKSAGLAIVFAAQPVILAENLNLNAPDHSALQRAVDRLKALIDEAAEFSAEGFALMSGPDPGSEHRPEAIAVLAKSLSALCRHAEVCHLPLFLETFDRVPFGKNCLIGPTAEAVPLARQLRTQHPAFGLMMDLSHLPLLGERPEQCLTTARELLAHVHIGNCAMRDPQHPAYGDNHPRFGCPGTEVGAAELANFLRQLLQIDYLNEQRRPIVSFEVKPMPGETSTAVLAGAKRTLAHAWRMV